MSWYYVQYKNGMLLEVDASSETDGEPLINRKFKSEEKAEQYIVDNDLRITIIPHDSKFANPFNAS